jgi:hypothetical protein
LQDDETKRNINWKDVWKIFVHWHRLKRIQTETTQSWHGKLGFVVSISRMRCMMHDLQHIRET